MQIQFLGATKTVTGSKYLITYNNTNVMVDCGLFQGEKLLRQRNWLKMPFHPAAIQYVILTHAHIDHSGYIPLLVKNGFRGKIFCSEPTKDLCEILLPDSGYLHEEEAHYAMRKGYSKHHPPLPLYTQKEAEKSLAYLHPLPFDKENKLDEDTHFSLYYAGHILGASFVHFQHRDRSILFTGDLGRPNDPIMNPPAPPLKADYFVIESTYGDRLHEATDPTEELSHIIHKTVKRGGVIVIPSFAVGRAQAILYSIYQLKSQNKIPDIPVFIDSPMATDVTKLFYKHHHYHRLSEKVSREVCQTATYINSVEQSKALHQHAMPMIIISASGMATGGRVLHHIRRFAPDDRNAIVFCGFQASGTRGDRLLRGEKEIKMFGSMVPIRAQVYELSNTSAHVDYKEMLAWLSKQPTPPKKTFITHGEDSASEALKINVEEQLGWACEIPEYLQKVTL
ncbi:MBL fold metallo-hydrolase [Legionella sp. W05-934-2]|uniref:MBL fold metallo-hydrolase n=1 Tax=Legionella sp. W05-934-2 TaxID=1198649 RepID=UPI0034627E0D